MNTRVAQIENQDPVYIQFHSIQECNSIFYLCRMTSLELLPFMRQQPNYIILYKYTFVFIGITSIIIELVSIFV